MRRVLAVALIVILSGVISCSDMPTAPQAPVGDITVEGIITDRDGPALANVVVAFRLLPVSPGRFSPYISAFTDVNGYFRIALAQGLYEIRIEPGYQSGLPGLSIPKFEVKAPVSRLDYKFSGTRVTGEITGPGGALLDRGYVSAVSTTDPIYLNVATVNGHYSMLLPPGDYEIYAESGIYGSGIPAIEVEAEVAASDTLINFALTGHMVTATATLGGGTPLPQVQVFARSEAIGVQAGATSRLDGSAVLYLPSGGYSFIAYSPDGSIVGPEDGYWSISGDASIPIDFPGTRWDVTLRRTADNAALPFTSIRAVEIGSNRSASATSDLLGKCRMFVRPDLGYDLHVISSISGIPIFVVPNVSSTADSTFDLFVDLPVP